jgi:cell division protein FtsW
MQPSELGKFGLLVFSADLLARRAGSMHDPRLTKRPILLAFAVVGALLMAQPDLGTTMVTGTIVMTVLFVAGLPVRSMFGLVGAAAGLTAVLAKVEPYRWQRMTSFLDPFADASNTGYQAAQARLALASGGWAGTGLGASKAKWGFLPAAHTDFIFAIVGEELGLIGTLAIVFLFGALAALGVRAALRAPDRFGTLMASGITAWIVGQAIVNIGAVVGLLPITGVPLPFVSAGGSSLGILMAAAGLLLNITRQARPVKTTGAAPVAAQ